MKQTLLNIVSMTRVQYLFKRNIYLVYMCVLSSGRIASFSGGNNNFIYTKKIFITKVDFCLAHSNDPIRWKKRVSVLFVFCQPNV